MKLIDGLKNIKLCYKWEDISIEAVIVKNIDLLEKYEDVFIFRKYISEGSPVAIFKEGELEYLPIILNSKIEDDFAIEYTIKEAANNTEEDKEIEPYCINCGNEDFPNNFEYEDHYANGYKYVCKDCGESVWLSEKEHDDFFY